MGTYHTADTNSCVVDVRTSRKAAGRAEYAAGWREANVVRIIVLPEVDVDWKDSR
jgi:hypothetical protein